MILVTGGLGYIGSHTVVELAADLYSRGINDETIVIVDNLSNSRADVMDKINALVAPYGVNVKLYIVDCRDYKAVSAIFDDNAIDAVIHFAGLKAVGESVYKPIEYYSHNIDATLNLARVMLAHKCNKIVFSSSATVYGEKNPVPYVEDMPTASMSPYGWSKVMQEQILRDVSAAEARHDGFYAVMLRYFNPIGAHESGLLGDDPNGIPNNLMPYICRVSNGTLESLSIYGDDYPTPDGTCIRDYIHVVDLARGHVKALEFMNKTSPAATAINLGTGHGYSVKEIVAAFEKSCGFKINKHIAPRRAGDIPKMEASVALAQKLLGWKATLGIDKMCADSWRFVCNKK